MTFFGHHTTAQGALRRQSSGVVESHAYMQDRATILLTGFGPFPGVPWNASGEFARDLGVAARARLDGWRVEDAILPTEWRAGPERLRALWRETNPLLALHFGVSPKARGFVIETSARNTADLALDASGQLPETGCISHHGPNRCPVTVPAARILDRLHVLGFPASLSRDAGSYLCNAVLYHSLTRTGARGGRPMAGFIHLPANLGGGTRPDPMSWQDAVAGGLEILDVCLAHAGGYSAGAGKLARAR